MKKFVVRVTTSPMHTYNVLCGIKLPRGVVEGPSEALKRFPLGSEVFLDTEVLIYAWRQVRPI